MGEPDRAVDMWKTLRVSHMSTAPTTTATTRRLVSATQRVHLAGQVLMSFTLFSSIRGLDEGVRFEAVCPRLTRTGCMIAAEWWGLLNGHH